MKFRRMRKSPLEFGFVVDTFSLEIVDGRETEDQRKQREEKQAALDRAVSEKSQTDWIQ